MGSELEGYRERLAMLNDQALELIQGVSTEGLNWRPLGNAADPETNSLAATLIHLTGTQLYYIGAGLGGRPIQRDRAAEYRASVADPAVLEARVAQTNQMLAEVLPNLAPEKLEEQTKWNDRLVAGRWLILHIIGHSGQHLGHMQLTRQLWDSRGQGE